MYDAQLQKETTSVYLFLSKEFIRSRGLTQEADISHDRVVRPAIEATLSMALVTKAFILVS